MKIKADYYKMAIDASEIIQEAKPGQFIHIRVTDTYEPLLRRPFSIHRIKNNNIEILYEVVGRGTEILSERKKGECLDILGPLGNGFDIKSTLRLHSRLMVSEVEPSKIILTPLVSGQKSKILLVAGGIGVAPLLFLADHLSTYQLTNLSAVLIGAKTKKRLLCEKEFKDLGCDIKISTDDGSKGFKGKVTELLKTLIPTYYLLPTVIYACGPREMLGEIVEISKRYNISSFGSLEENLGCGIGVCLGCVVKTRSGYKKVCRDGPVFNLEEIIW